MYENHFLIKSCHDEKIVNLNSTNAKEKSVNYFKKLIQFVKAIEKICKR